MTWRGEAKKTAGPRSLIVRGKENNKRGGEKEKISPHLRARKGYVENRLGCWWGWDGKKESRARKPPIGTKNPGKMGFPGWIDQQTGLIRTERTGVGLREGKKPGGPLLRDNLAPSSPGEKRMDEKRPTTRRTDTGNLLARGFHARKSRVGANRQGGKTELGEGIPQFQEICPRRRN